MPSPEFIETANAMLDEIFSEMYPPEYYVASDIAYFAEDEPKPQDYVATGTVPGSDILLGMYTDEPPTIRIYENSIEKAKSLWEGDTVTAVKAVLSHEIWQHGLGLDHTKETILNGFNPAFTLPHDTSWCGCHRITGLP